ncbi:MAG TPA: hypothetical protein VHG10_05105 [Glycomyces sp.]|nr:hypothetical protein [Glycomyces sp.]
MFTVHFNRRRLWLLLAASTPLAVASLFWPDASSFGDAFLGGFMWGLARGLPILSIVLLVRKKYLVYDIRHRTIVVPQRRRQYPRFGFNRLEYSVYDARIYQVGNDGKRRKIAGRSPFLDRQDWEALVDILVAQQMAWPAQPPRLTAEHRTKSPCTPCFGDRFRQPGPAVRRR